MNIIIKHVEFFQKERKDSQMENKVLWILRKRLSGTLGIMYTCWTCRYKPKL